jgi:biotin operon repressor
MRKTDSKAIVLELLTIGPCTKEDLRKATGLSITSIRPILSRLRDEGFDIVNRIKGERSVYELLSGPGSLGPSFVCPACRETIRLGHVTDHQDSCQFGPKVLHSLKDPQSC